MYGGVGGVEPRGSPLSRSLAQTGGPTMGRACPLCPGISDVNLFRYCQGIYLNAKISDPVSAQAEAFAFASEMPSPVFFCRIVAAAVVSLPDVFGP